MEGEVSAPAIRPTSPESEALAPYYLRMVQHRSDEVEMSRAKSWMLIVGAMSVIVMVLLAVAMTPEAINLRTPPSRGVSADARVTTAMQPWQPWRWLGLATGLRQTD